MGQLAWPSGADRKLRPWPSGQIWKFKLHGRHPRDLILDGFEPQPSVPHCHDGHDLALQPDSILEAALESAPIFNSEPAAQIEDGWLDTASGDATSTVMEPNTDLIPC